jgi:hypothetical protein
MLGALLGAGAAIGSALINKRSAKDAGNASRAASAEAFERDHEAYKTRYQDTTTDMRKAGLNPILAASGGFNVGNSVTSNMPQTFMPEPINFASSAESIGKAMESSANVEKTKEETKLTAKKVVHEYEKILKTRADKKLVTAKEKESVQQQLNLLKMHEKLMAEIRHTDASTETLKTKLKPLKLLNKRIMEGQMRLEEYTKLYKNSTSTVKVYLKNALEQVKGKLKNFYIENGGQ